MTQNQRACECDEMLLVMLGWAKEEVQSSFELRVRERVLEQEVRPSRLVVAHMFCIQG